MQYLNSWTRNLIDPTLTHEPKVELEFRESEGGKGKGLELRFCICSTISWLALWPGTWNVGLDSWSPPYVQIFFEQELEKGLAWKAILSTSQLNPKSGIFSWRRFSLLKKVFSKNFLIQKTTLWLCGEIFWLCGAYFLGEEILCPERKSSREKIFIKPVLYRANY